MTNMVFTLGHSIFSIATRQDFNAAQEKLKLLREKDQRIPKKIGTTGDKISYTILSCCNAMGQFLTMHILFKGPRLMSAHCLNGPKDATYDVSESGWMEGALCLNL